MTPRTLTDPTPQTLIDALGGSGQVADALKRASGTVASWRHRNAIPSEEWPNFIALARLKGVRGVTAESMLAMHPTRLVDILNPTPAEVGAAR